MANEAKAVELINEGEVLDFTVADGKNIPKGTICALSDPRTALASSGANVFAGIAATEKKANNGQTNLGLYTKGVFEITPVSGAGIVAGDIVKISGTNVIGTASATDLVNGKGLGKALETQSGSNKIEVQLNYG